jgi:hypothetical protein
MESIALLRRPRPRPRQRQQICFSHAITLALLALSLSVYSRGLGEAGVATATAAAVQSSIRMPNVIDSRIAYRSVAIYDKTDAVGVLHSMETELAVLRITFDQPLYVLHDSSSKSSSPGPIPLRSVLFQNNNMLLDTLELSCRDNSKVFPIQPWVQDGYGDVWLSTSAKQQSSMSTQSRVAYFPYAASSLPAQEVTRLFDQVFEASQSSSNSLAFVIRVAGEPQLSLSQITRCRISTGHNSTSHSISSYHGAPIDWSQQAHIQVEHAFGGVGYEERVTILRAYTLDEQDIQDAKALDASGTGLAFVDIAPPRVTPSAEECRTYASFIEERAVFLEEGVQVVSEVTKPVFDTMLQPFTDQIMDIVGENVMDDLSKNVAHNMQQGIPRLVTGKTVGALAPNLTNILGDTVPYGLTNKLTDTLTDTLGERLTRTMHDSMAPRMTSHLDNILTESVPPPVSSALAESLDRSLAVILVAKLTRSLTHTLLPVLTQALSYNIKQEDVCNECRSGGSRCNECRYSLDQVYYTNFYGCMLQQLNN